MEKFCITMARFAALVLFISFSIASLAQVKTIDGLYGVNSQMPANYIKNKGCYTSTRDITASGGSLTRNTTTPLENGADCAIDSSASGQTYSWSTYTFDRSTAGQNCQAIFSYKGDASLYKAYVNVNSVKVSGDTQLTNVTSDSRMFSVNFPCGSQPLTTAVVIESTSASAAAINVSNVYAGLATNLSNVAQATMVGSAYIAGTLNCAFSRTNTAIGAFTTDADCPGPTVEINQGPGTIQTTDANLPRFTVNDLPAGNYQVVMSGAIGAGTALETACLGINDGTTTSGNVCIKSASSSLNGTTVVANFSYTTAGNRTFELYGSATAGTIDLLGSASGQNRIGFSIYRFPSSSEMAVRPDQSDFGWTSYTPTVAGFGTVTGVSVKYMRKGDSLYISGYFSTGTVAATTASVSLPSGLVIDTTKIAFSRNVAGRWATARTAATGDVIYSTGTTTTDIYFGPIQNSTSNLTANQGSQISSNGVDFSFTAGPIPIVGWTNNQAAPILVGSVTSDGSSAYRTERAEINCDAGSAITRQTVSTFLSSVGNISSGACALTFGAGITPANAYCTFQPATRIICRVTASNSEVNCMSDAAVNATAFDGVLDCLVPR